MGINQIYVRPIADEQYKNNGHTGWTWIQDLSTKLNSLTSVEYVNIDLSNIKYICLYELVSCVALCEKLIRENRILKELGFDFTGGNLDSTVVSQEDLIRKRKHQPLKNLYSSSDITNSNRWERLQGFIESIGTRRALEDSYDNGERSVRITFPFIGSGYGKPFKYADDMGTTVISGIWRVQTAENCAELLSASNIQDWKIRMGQLFLDIPYFATNELWRTFFFEFAINIIEHAGGTPGFLTGRVIKPGALTCKKIGIWPEGADGVLELCICDSGEGIANTLKKIYKAKFRPRAIEIKPNISIYIENAFQH